jgi:hypothetical protein
MTNAPAVTPVALPTQFSNAELADLDAAFTAADTACKQAESWLADAAGRVQAAGEAFARAVAASYPDAESAVKALDKAERQLAAAKRDQALLANVATYQRSLAEGAAQAATSKLNALTGDAVMLASVQWREDRDAVAKWFSAEVIDSFLATPEALRAIGSVGPDVLNAYHSRLAQLDAARRQLNDRGASLNELEALNPKHILARAASEGRFAVPAA